jgi:hypothetical protein
LLEQEGSGLVKKKEKDGAQQPCQKGLGQEKGKEQRSEIAEREGIESPEESPDEETFQYGEQEDEEELG